MSSQREGGPQAIFSRLDNFLDKYGSIEKVSFFLYFFFFLFCLFFFFFFFFFNIYSLFHFSSQQ